MASFLARRLGAMLLTMLCLTLVVFYLVNLEPNLRKVAISQTETPMVRESEAGRLLRESREREARELRDRPGQFDSRRAAAHDEKGQAPC